MIKFKPGDIVSWWPGDTDYPSTVELIQPVEYGWRVNYAEDPISEDWDVLEEELIPTLIGWEKLG